MERIGHNKGSNPPEDPRLSPKKNTAPDAQATAQDSATPSTSSASCDSFQKARTEEPPASLLPSLLRAIYRPVIDRLNAPPAHKELRDLKAMRATNCGLNFFTPSNHRAVHHLFSAAIASTERMGHNKGSNPLEDFHLSPKNSIPPDAQATGQDSAAPSTRSASSDSFQEARAEEPPPLPSPSLPTEIHFAIIDKLNALPAHEELHALKALRATNRDLKTSVDAHERYALLRQVERHISIVCSILRSRSTRPLARLSSVPLDWVNPADRAELVEYMLNKVGKYKGHPDVPPFFLVARHMQHLSAEQRDTLVTSILLGIRLPSERHKACAIGSLGIGLKHLSCEHKASLVEATLKMKEQALAEAIGGPTELDVSGLGLDSDDLILEEAKLRALIRVADGKTFGLGAGLEHLTDMQKGSLVDATLEIDSPDYRATAIGGFGAALEHLTDPQKESLVQKAVSDRKTRALHGLMTGFEHLSDTQQFSLSDAALSTLPHIVDLRELTVIIRKLGSCLQYLSEPQKNLLVNSILTAGDLFRGAGVNAIGGLGAGLQYLSEDQRQSLVIATANYIRDIPNPHILTNEEDVAAAIRGLGAGSQYLTHGQRTSLLEAALEIAPILHRSREDLVICGFGTWLQHLTDDQKATLVYEATGNALPLTIGELGRGLQHLTTDQYDSLLNATSHLLRNDVRHAAGGLVEGLLKLAEGLK